MRTFSPRPWATTLATTLAVEFGWYLFYFQFFANGNFVLFTAGFYDRVHAQLRKNWVNEKFRLRGGTWKAANYGNIGLFCQKIFAFAGD